MSFKITNITTELELDEALELEKSVFGQPSETNSPEYSREKWIARMNSPFRDLMLYAEINGEMIGIVFGRVENERSVTVGPVAVCERHRKMGVAKKLMQTLEKRALAHGINHLGLGAAESAEGFYSGLGYSGSLLIQSEIHGTDELLKLNTKYKVNFARVHDGYVNQVNLELPAPDRELQQRYESEFPGCYTQMIFQKNILDETNDDGDYARHAKYWDWGGHDRAAEHEYWLKYSSKYGKNILIPMCALGETGAYMAERGCFVTAFDIEPEMIIEGRKRFGGVKGLNFYEGDVRDFIFEIAPADFCFCSDFGHIHSIGEIKAALACINNHLRVGGCLVIETGLRQQDGGSNQTPEETFYPQRQVYPGIKVWKTGVTRNDGGTGRCYISQTFYAERDGETESFKHEFYLQSYYREEWLEAFNECGFIIAGEYNSREVENWLSGGGSFRIFEAVKTAVLKNEK